MATFYLNGPTHSSATAVFTDNNLSVCAADAFYSDGIIVREQVDCVLLPPQLCPECSIPCGSTIVGSGGQGLYRINLDAGTDIGAVIIRFNPQSVPDGVKAIYNSITYNKLTSPLDGLHQGLTGDYTYIGDTEFDCGISGTTYETLDEFLYNGTSFISTGNTEAVTVNPGSVSLSDGAPGSCMMVIPKPTAAPSIINFVFVGPCSGTLWNISIACPELLTGFDSSLVAASSALACELEKTETYYHASLDDIPGAVDVYDFVYADNLGSVPLADGFYYASGSIAGGADWFEVENGVVVAVAICGDFDFYIADEYNCSGCTLSLTNQVVALPSGTVPVYGNYYAPTGVFAGYYYKLLFPTTPSPALILDTPNSTSCGPC
jgi:hypothetical protein